MIGLPGETEKTIRKTWNFSKRVKADFLQFSLSTPYPGTELYEYAKKNDWIEGRNWNEFNADAQAAMRTDELSVEVLEKWVKTLNFRRFGLQLIRNPWNCLKMYTRKALQSPRKILNVFKALGDF
ncbi:hypothetical protein HYY75_01170 [bacterium]|nr:hypothetical protein [bacterium]